MHETSRSSLQAWDRNQHFQEDKNLKIKFLLKNTVRDCEQRRVSLRVKVPQLFTWRTLSPCTVRQSGQRTRGSNMKQNSSLGVSPVYTRKASLGAGLYQRDQRPELYT